MPKFKLLIRENPLLRAIYWITIQVLKNHNHKHYWD